MTLYHRSQLLYAEGDVILGGNWGRVILGLGPAHGRFYPEYVLESMRRREFARKPSRMASAFAFDDVERAESWARVIVQGVKEHIYAVEPATGAAIHRGNLGWIDAMATYRTFEGVESCALSYWRGDDREGSAWECIVGGSLRVVQRLTPIPEDPPPRAGGG